MLKNIKFNTKVGILVLDRDYLLVPGNTARSDSYPYPVHIKRILGLYNPPNPPVRYAGSGLSETAKIFIEAITELPESVPSLRAIVTSCGFFSLMQREANNVSNVPVYTSPLIFVPFLQSILPSDCLVGVLTLFHEYLTDEYFEAIEGIDRRKVVLSNMESAKEFRRMIEYDLKNVDKDKLEKEVLKSAKELVRSNPSIRALVIECSDMTPYTNKIKNLIGLPTYDYRTLVDLAFYSLSSKDK